MRPQRLPVPTARHTSTSHRDKDATLEFISERISLASRLTRRTTQHQLPTRSGCSLHRIVKVVRKLLFGSKLVSLAFGDWVVLVLLHYGPLILPFSTLLLWMDGFMTCTGSFISPELGEALQSIKGVVAAFERDVRSDVKWDSALVRDRIPRTCRHPAHSSSPHMYTNPPPSKRAHQRVCCADFGF